MSAFLWSENLHETHWAKPCDYRVWMLGPVARCPLLSILLSGAKQGRDIKDGFKIVMATLRDTSNPHQLAGLPDGTSIDAKHLDR